MARSVLPFAVLFFRFRVFTLSRLRLHDHMIIFEGLLVDYCGEGIEACDNTQTSKLHGSQCTHTRPIVRGRCGRRNDRRAWVGC